MSIISLLRIKSSLWWVCTLYTLILSRADHEAVFQYERITLTPCTKSYFFLALLHCITQVILQSITFSSNKTTSNTIHKIFNAASIQPTFAFVQNDILRVCEGVPLQGTNDPCWPIAGPGLQFNHSISAQLESRDFKEDDTYIFERDDDEDSDDEDDDTDSLASDDDDRDDKDDDKQSQEKEEQREQQPPKSEKEDPIEDDRHDEDDTDDDEDDEDDEVTYKKTDDISGKLTNVSISDFLVGINAGNNTKLSTRCVRALSWPEIV